MTAMLRLTVLAGLLWPIAAAAQVQSPAQSPVQMPVQIPVPAEAPILVPNAAEDCDVPAYLLSTESALTKVGAAIKDRNKLNILVVGSRSSSLQASAGQPLAKSITNNPTAINGPADAAYPSRLQQMLSQKLPSLAISVSVDLQPRKTAEEVAASLATLVAARKPDLVVWQTGTVDAMRGIDLDDFRSAMDDGVKALQAAGSDVILMNLQYSPRTETMTSPTPYVDNMRVVAQDHDVPVFDRFAIMRHWHEDGDFDLFNPSPGIDLAKKVHECLARALATFVIDAAHVNSTELKTQR